MKIGILTQPLHNNYGGLLQAYALQKVLKDMGHEVVTIDLRSKEMTVLRKILSIGKRIVQRYLLGKDVPVRVWPTNAEREVISSNTRKFVNTCINTTEKFYAPIRIGQLEKFGFDAYVVGSDQVWRPRYSPFLPNFFLDFLLDHHDVKRIAYAASFGTSDWEFTQKQTDLCAALAKKFDAISVREGSGVQLCRDKLGVDATHVLDPTMLLEKEDYVKLINEADEPGSPGNLFYYILDKSEEKEAIINHVSNQKQLKPFTVMPSSQFIDGNRQNLSECVYPSVTKWLRAFMDAEFVITDSFHGTVFSIIFHKPFLSINNSCRGGTRFESLLKSLNLQNRLVSVDEINFNEIELEFVDFNLLNQVFVNERGLSKKFLCDNLAN